jgi:hypothetical protein
VATKWQRFDGLACSAIDIQFRDAARVCSEEKAAILPGAGVQSERHGSLHGARLLLRGCAPFSWAATVQSKGERTLGVVARSSDPALRPSPKRDLLLQTQRSKVLLGLIRC